MLEDGRREVTGDRVKRGGNIVATLTTQSGKIASLRAPDSTLPFSEVPPGMLQRPSALTAITAVCHAILSVCPVSTFSLVLLSPIVPCSGACRVPGDPDRGQGVVLTICR